MVGRSTRYDQRGRARRVLRDVGYLPPSLNFKVACKAIRSFSEEASSYLLVAALKALT